MLKYVFGFAQAEEKCTSALGNKSILAKNGENSVLQNANANNNSKKKINGFE